MRKDSADHREAATTNPRRKAQPRRSDVHAEIGDRVTFKTNTGQTTAGRVVQRILEKRQPTILLIERPEDGWRAFRLETEVSVLPKPPQPALATVGTEAGEWT